MAIYHVNSFRPGETYLGTESLVHVMAWGLFVAINSLSCSEDISQHISGSILAQVMACCLTAPSRYLNQCLFLMSEVLWHSPEKSSFLASAQATNQYNEYEIYCFYIIAIPPRSYWVNTLRPRQNGRRLADDTFKCIFLNENVRISIKISPKFVPKGPINNIPALVQIMAWRRSGDKPLSEPMMVNLLTHICVTLPQWVKRNNAKAM